MESAGQTTQINYWLDRHRAGDPKAKAELIAHSCERLRVLASKLLRQNFGRLARWEETGDVLQSSLTQLHRSLDAIQPESVDRFLGLAALQIRRTLLDLIRHHFGPQGMSGKHHTDEKNEVPAVVSVPASEGEPQSLEDWTAFHEAVEKLPNDEKAVFDLVYYDGLSHVEAAQQLGINERTIRRRWSSAKILLSEALIGETSE